MSAPLVLPGRPERPLAQAMRRGFCCHCPNCGRGRLFRSFLKTVERCGVCGEELFHHRADDAPPYFVIFITGHIVVPMALAAEIAFSPPYWVHAALWTPITLLFVLGLLPPIKGAIVGWQWANRMHGFDPGNRDDEIGG